MNRKIILKIASVITAFVIVILLFTMVFVSPWIEKRIRTALKENDSKYQVDIGRVRISLFALELGTITIRTKQGDRSHGNLNGEITSIKFNGINLLKTILKNDIEISEVVISKLNGRMLFSDDSVQQIISSLNLKINKIHFDNINIAIKNSSSAESYSIKEGILNIYDLQLSKKDTLSSGIAKKFDFKAREVLSVSVDSMYTITAVGITNDLSSRTLMLDSFLIHPNYKEYEFVSRKKFQTNRFDARFSKIHIHNFSAANCLTSGNLESSYIKIEKMDMNVFSDKRKDSQPGDSPMFQAIIYSYPGKINIDSICVKSGNIIYTEHARQANHPGWISFNEINAKIYRITNDTIFKKKKAYLELAGNGLLMGKSKAIILLKVPLFDRNNTFSLSGVFSAIDAKELNPILERNAYLYATSGRADKMTFNFTANNNKAVGKMILLYHELHLSAKNKQTDDTTALKEKVFSVITNIKVMDSNPLPGKKLRMGIIDFERNTEKSFLYYCSQSILSGIRSSIAKDPSKPIPPLN